MLCVKSVCLLTLRFTGTAQKYQMQLSTPFPPPNFISMINSGEITGLQTEHIEQKSFYQNEDVASTPCPTSTKSELSFYSFEDYPQEVNFPL